jgi:hypothetical protein
MKSVNHSFDFVQAYLEMARAHHHVVVRAPKGVSPKGLRMTNNTVLALTAHGYVFSFMAVNAFVTVLLWKVWELPNSPLKSNYPKAKSFKHLLKTDLKELKDGLSEACLHYGVKPMHLADPQLWNEFLKIVKWTRDFMTHPTPDPIEFSKIIGDALEKHTWERPARIAERVIQYFYAAESQTPPEWLKQNKEFCFETIRALSAQSRLQF